MERFKIVGYSSSVNYAQVLVYDNDHDRYLWQEFTVNDKDGFLLVRGEEKKGLEKVATDFLMQKNVLKKNVDGTWVIPA